jgi:Amidohydrolase
MAEEYDLPVGIHMGPGPPGAAYDSNPAPFKSPAFAMAAGDPMLLEGVLLRHKKLRLFVMHAGWPRLESMVALLYAHPRVYVDLAALERTSMVPRTASYHNLQGLIENGLAVLVGMFAVSVRGQSPNGEDQPESQIRRGFEIAPVPLNLQGRNRAWVGMGSYLVNAVGDCNGCHAGPSGEYAPGGNPFQWPSAVWTAGRRRRANALCSRSMYT